MKEEKTMSEEMKNNMQEINRWNHIANPRLILVGQKLKIYVR